MVTSFPNKKESDRKYKRHALKSQGTSITVRRSITSKIDGSHLPLNLKSFCNGDLLPLGRLCLLDHHLQETLIKSGLHGACLDVLRKGERSLKAANMPP